MLYEVSMMGLVLYRRNTSGVPQDQGLLSGVGTCVVGQFPSWRISIAHVYRFGGAVNCRYLGFLGR